MPNGNLVIRFKLVVVVGVFVVAAWLERNGTESRGKGRLVELLQVRGGIKNRFGVGKSRAKRIGMREMVVRI